MYCMLLQREHFRGEGSISLVSIERKLLYYLSAYARKAKIKSK